MFIGIVIELHTRDSIRLGRRRITFIHILDDDSLLNIFRYCCPVIVDRNEFDNFYTFRRWSWEDERWWCHLVKVCRRWRFLIFGSAFQLGVNLLCIQGAQVVDMLAHGPPLPLTIDRLHRHRLTTQDSEDILLALKHRDRIRRIRLQTPVPDLETLIAAMNGEFPMLECLTITPPSLHCTNLMLPSAFHAPHLRHLMLLGIAFPIASPSLTTPASLVSLSLRWVHPSTFLLPDELLQRLSFTPRLETLQISFGFSISDDNVEKQMTCATIMTHVALPNLRHFAFEGDNPYMEMLLSCMTTPLLEKLKIVFFHEHTLHVPHLLQLLTVTESLKFSLATITFYKEFLSLTAYPRGAIGRYFSIRYFDNGTLHDQITSAAQIFSSLRTLFAAVEYLTLGCEREFTSQGRHVEAYHTQWCNFFQSFPSVKSLRVEDRRTGDLSRSLQFDHGEPPVCLLPQLEKLLYTSREDAVGVFSAFADACRKSGRPIILAPL